MNTETYAKNLSDSELIDIVKSYNNWFECASKGVELDSKSALRVHARQLIFMNDKPLDYEVAYMKDLASAVCRILATRWVEQNV